MFGLMNAPFYFSRLMELALGSLRNRILLFYLDDIFVPARNWKELLDRLRQIFQALIRAGLTLKLEKCVFGLLEVQFLGFKISAKGVEPGESKVLAIEQFERPQDIHAVRRFLGMTGFFR